MCIYVQLEKVKEFATSLKATDDHNFQYAGNNIEKIITEKVNASCNILNSIANCGIHVNV